VHLFANCHASAGNSAFLFTNAKQHRRGRMEMMRRPIRNGQDDHRWRKWITGLALGVVIFSGSAYGFAPHLSRLLFEGFPAVQWPASGDYAEISGVLAPTDVRHSGLNPNVWAQQLFEQYDGKALLVYHEGHLKLEHYASDVSAQAKFNSYSMAKSLVGACP
jgi:hypothetical protein